MEWKEISIADKALFERYFQMKDYEVSDFTFTNLFIWHFSRLIRYAVVDDFLCLQIQYAGLPPIAFMPLGTGDLKPVLTALSEDFRSRDIPFKLRALTKPMIEQIEQAMPGHFKCKPQRDRFDYVYRVEDLVKLEGSKYKDKRNHINIFQKTYQYAYSPMTVELLPKVVEAEIEWCRKHDCASQENLENEKTGILQATDHFDQLEYQGGVLMIDGQIVAFTFGEALTKDTVVIHIEKADPDIRGAYPMINQQFLEHHWQHMTYVNREEDLGIPGLRKAKKSYHPARMIEKHVATER